MSCRQYSLARNIVTIFNQTFAKTEATLLAFGGSEPVYYPAGCQQNPGPYHRIYFAHGFINSALHEIAHWCIAGKIRRNSIDYGYWYQPDGRSRDQQRLFTQVEIKPQALEWHFALACGVKFYLSSDNLNGNQQDTEDGSNSEFKQAVCTQARRYLQHGLPVRAKIFKKACVDQFSKSRSCLDIRQQCQDLAAFAPDKL